MFVYDGGMLADSSHVTLRAQELHSYQCVTDHDIDQYMNRRLAHRLRYALDARSAGRTAELVNGVGWPASKTTGYHLVIVMGTDHTSERLCDRFCCTYRLEPGDKHPNHRSGQHQYRWNDRRMRSRGGRRRFPGPYRRIDRNARGNAPAD